MTDPDFRDAFHSHKHVLYRFAYRLIGSSLTAEDIVQDCFVALWRNENEMDRFRSRSVSGLPNIRGASGAPAGKRIYDYPTIRKAVIAFKLSWQGCVSAVSIYHVRPLSGRCPNV
jgi:hypothetical protein